MRDHPALAVPSTGIVPNRPIATALVLTLTACVLAFCLAMAFGLPSA